MRRCIQTHTVASFGEIPAGSLWADDSPYAVEADMFEPVDDAPAPAPAKKPVRKFVGEQGPELVVLPPGAVIISTEGEATS